MLSSHSLFRWLQVEQAHHMFGKWAFIKGIVQKLKINGISLTTSNWEPQQREATWLSSALGGPDTGLSRVPLPPLLLEVQHRLPPGWIHHLYSRADLSPVPFNGSTNKHGAPQILVSSPSLLRPSSFRSVAGAQSSLHVLNTHTEVLPFDVLQTFDELTVQFNASF